MQSNGWNVDLSIYTKAGMVALDRAYILATRRHASAHDWLMRGPGPLVLRPAASGPTANFQPDLVNWAAWANPPHPLPRISASRTGAERPSTSGTAAGTAASGRISDHVTSQGRCRVAPRGPPKHGGNGRKAMSRSQPASGSNNPCFGNLPTAPRSKHCGAAGDR